MLCNPARWKPLPCLALIAVLILSATPAWAAETIEGDGYSLNVPRGYRAVPAEEADSLATQRIELTGGLSVEGTPEVFVYIRGSAVDPASFLLVSRIDLAEGSEMSSTRELQRYVLRNLSLSQEEFDKLAGEGGVEMKNRKIGRFEALEMRHTGTSGPLGVEQPATRALTVLGGDFVLVVVLTTLEENSPEEAVEWEGIVSSLDVDPTAALIKKILLYGGAGLAALTLLLFFLRVMGRGQGNAEPMLPVSSDGALSAEGWGRKSTPASGPPVPRAVSPPSTPSAASGAAGASSLPRTPSASPPPAPSRAPAGLSSPLSSAPVRSPVAPARSPVAPVRSPAAPARSPLSSPSGAVGALPTSPTSPRGPSHSLSNSVGAPGPSASSPAHQPSGARPISTPEETAPPASGGLRSTLPPSGRWGH